MTTDTHTHMSAATRARAHELYKQERTRYWYYTPAAHKAWRRAKQQAVREAHGEH